MNDLELMHCIERTLRSERRPDVLHILDETVKRLQVKPHLDSQPCPVCEAKRKQNIARQKRHRQKEQSHAARPETRS